MTEQQYVALRPDLAVNYANAQATDDDGNWSDGSEAAQYIRQFDTFDAYVQDDHGGPFDSPESQVGPPVKGDPAHDYVGREELGGQLVDVWQLYDPSRDRVLEWPVQAGDDSRNRIGELRDLGPPSSMTVAQRPAGSGGAQPPPNGNPISLAKPTILVGTTASGQPIKQLVDSGGLVKQWIEGNGAILDLVNAPSYGTLFHTTMTDAPKPGTGTGIVSGGGGTPPPGGTTTPPPSGGGAPGLPVKGDPSHFYVGRDARGDVWQLYVSTPGDPHFDHVLEWAVLPGHDSKELIAGTLRDIGPPSSMTVAQRPGEQTLAKPTIQVGTTSVGWAILQRVKDDGTAEQWIVNPITNAIVDLVSPVSYGVLYHDSVTDAAVNNNGGGVVTNNVPSSGLDKTAIVVAIIGAAALFLTRQPARR